MPDQYSAIYRGSVYDTVDPENRGRLRLLVPQVLGDAPSAWAEPTLPVSDRYQPKVNERVWVFFEGGDLNRPTYISKMEVASENIGLGQVALENLHPGVELGMTDAEQAALQDRLNVMEADIVDNDARLNTAADDIIATNNRLNPGGDVNQSISDAAASPVTDARLQAGSLTVWPFADNTIPEGTINSREIADFALQARKFNTTQHLIY